MLFLCAAETLPWARKRNSEKEMMYRSIKNISPPGRFGGQPRVRVGPLGTWTSHWWSLRSILTVMEMNLRLKTEVKRSSSANAVAAQSTEHRWNQLHRNTTCSWWTSASGGQTSSCTTSTPADGVLREEMCTTGNILCVSKLTSFPWMHFTGHDAIWSTEKFVCGEHTKA